MLTIKIILIFTSATKMPCLCRPRSMRQTDGRIAASLMPLHMFGVGVIKTASCLRRHNSLFANSLDYNESQ